MAYLSGWIDGKNIDVSYDSINRTITLAHASGFLRGYWKGRAITLASPWTSSAHSTGFGSYFLYSTDGTNITWSVTPWNFRHLHVAYVRYTAALKAGIREPHGLMDPDIHESLHINVGSWIKSGGTLTAGTYAVGAPESDANNTPGVDSVVVSDEDNESTLAALPQGNYTRVYVDNTNADVYTLNSSYPFSHTTAGFINYYVNGVETQGSQNNYYCIYGIAIPTTSDATSQAYRWIWLQAQKAYINIDLARAENISTLNLGDLLSIFPECAPRIKMIYRASAAYATTGKVRLEEFSYITKTLNISSAGVTTSSWATLADIPTSIKALADVIQTADTVPYFDSATTAATMTVTAFARTFLDDVSGAAVRATIGAGTSSFDGAYGSLTSIPASIDAIDGLTPAANQVAYYTGTTTASLMTVSAFARTFLDDADASSVRATIGAGTSSFDGAYGSLSSIPASINAIDGLVPAADLVAYYTGANSAGLMTVTTFARTLLDDVDAASVRSTIGAGTSSFSGAYSALSSIPASIDAIDGLTPAADLVAYYTGATTASTMTVTSFARTFLDDTTAAGVRATIGAGTSSFDGAYASLSGVPGTVTALGNLANAQGVLYNNGSGTLSWTTALLVSSGTQNLVDFGTSGNTAVTRTITDNIGIGFTDTRGVNWRGAFVSTNTYYGIAQEANDSFTDLKPFILNQAGTWAYMLYPTGALRHRFMGGTIIYGDVTIVGTTTLDTSLNGLLRATSGVVGNASTSANALVGVTAGADKVPYFTSTTAASTMTVTAFARTLLDDVDASSFLTTLGAASTTHASTHHTGGSDALVGSSIAGLTPTSAPVFYSANAARAGSDAVGNGPFIRVQDQAGTPTQQWLFQLGASNNLAVWNYNASTWTLRWNFLNDGTLRQGAFERITPTGGLRAADITGTYLKVTAPVAGDSYVNIDFNGGTSSNRRMSFRWDDVNDRLEMFTSNDDGSARASRLTIPRSSALPVVIASGLTVSSGYLNSGSLTASMLVASDGSKNLVSYTLVASDIPSLDWAKITTGKPTTLSGYGITNGVSKLSSTASIDVVANNWYRVATSVVGVGRNSGEFSIRWTVAGNHGAARFTASCHYNRVDSVSIQQSEYGKYVGGISKVRVVYYSGVYVGEYAYVEVMFDVSVTGVSITQEIRDAFGWSLNAVGDAGSIPANYTSYEHTFVALANVTAGTYAKVTINKEGRVISGASLASGDLPGAAGTLAALANSQGVLYNSGAGVLSWTGALPISSYSLLGFSNFGVGGTSAYSYGV
jgi:hypothetical protein